MLYLAEGLYHNSFKNIEDNEKKICQHLKLTGKPLSAIKKCIFGINPSISLMEPNFCVNYLTRDSNDFLNISSSLILSCLCLPPLIDTSLAYDAMIIS